MKIIFFARLFYPHVGGVEKHVLELGKELIKDGHEITVITENYQSLPLSANIAGINIIRINVGEENWFKKIKVWQELFKHLQIIRSADIIHCHDIFFWYLPFRFIFPFKKIYTTFHGYEGNKTPNRRAIIMHKIAEKLSNGNICIGNFYKKWYGTNASLVSFGAVDEQLIKQGAKQNNPTKEAMFLGRLEEETGIMEYLKSIRETKIKLDVFGEGSLKKQAKEYVKQNKLNVTFKGFIANATDYIKDYKYIFTSRYLGIIEAMSLKKPIFTVYNNPIKKDYLEMTPFSSYIAIAKDGDEITKEFNNYIKGKSKINIVKEYDWVKTQTWQNMTATYLKLWQIK